MEKPTEEMMMEIDESNVKRTNEVPEDDIVIKKAKVNVFSTELLRVYYARLFPHDQMFQWLSYGADREASSDFFFRREFSFTIENDVYIRYLSFRNLEEMRKAILLKQPHKIDIGPVYSSPPKDHNMVKATSFKPLERELVFDIDLTDYDEVRTGCTPDLMWERQSWLYMSVAIKIVDQSLREDFGFKHMLWVFSGRRGVHCWVCDPRARALDDKGRTSVVNYLTLISGNENSSNRVALSSPMHPAVERAMPHMHTVFEEMVLPESGQGLLADEERWTRVLNHVPNEEIRERLSTAWLADATGNSVKRWKQLSATVRDAATKKKEPEASKLRACINSIIILHTYPRLDVNVSTHRNHLLKSPFVIHPKTGKVCVPIFDVDNSHKFDPDNVPTLPSLVKEIDAIQEGDSDQPEYGMTSMKQYIDGFQNLFLKPLMKTIKSQELEAKRKADGANGDW